MLDERIRTNDKDPFFTWMAFVAPNVPFEAPDSSILDQYDNLRTRNVLSGMIYRMDLMVGQILKDLERAGELDNTVIIFSQIMGLICEAPHFHYEEKSKLRRRRNSSACVS